MPIHETRIAKMSGSAQSPFSFVTRHASAGFVTKSLIVSTNALRKPSSERRSHGSPSAGAPP
jgi:hypothetical protein